MKTLYELEEQAKNLYPTHKFLWDRPSSLYKQAEHSYGKCIYCTQTVQIDLWKENITSNENITCLSVGRTIDPEGLAVTTYAVCKDCGKKINPKHTNEVIKGFHSKCQNKYDGTLVLDIHDNQVRVWMQPFLPVK